MNLSVRRMTKEDIAQAVEIERICFSEPWSEADYNESLLLDYAKYYVALLGDDVIIGICGVRNLAGEGEIQVNGEGIPLTKSEYLICEYLARNKGQVFSKEQIYETVFGLEGDSDNSTISTHIKNIRSKLNKLDIQPIETVWGIGYKWE